MEKKTTVAAYESDVKRLVDMRAYPKEPLADVLERSLNTFMGCRGMAPLSDENAMILSAVLRALREKKVDASALEAMDVIFKASARVGVSVEAGRR